jgi:hypothetical protein
MPQFVDMPLKPTLLLPPAMFVTAPAATPEMALVVVQPAAPVAVTPERAAPEAPAAAAPAAPAAPAPYVAPARAPKPYRH